MSSYIILFLLVIDLVLFLAAAIYFDKSSGKGEPLLLSVLFFFSGMPALIYQIVWQRVLFAIYGVNAESVAVIVSAFMLGLGLGSLVGGRLSSRFPRHGILIFSLAELGIALFGISSLHIFHWAASLTAGASLPSVIVFSLLLLLVPTILMGATLPLLVGQLVRRLGHVGLSVSRLYFVNTFGSAVACYLCAVFLMRALGQSGSVFFAACLNTLVGTTAYLCFRRGRFGTKQEIAEPPPAANVGIVPLPVAMLFAGLSGFIALGFEIAWFRVFSLASSDRAPAFALLLATYLAGIAAGSYVSEKLTQGMAPSATLRIIAVLMMVAGVISSYLPPLVASLMAGQGNYLSSAPAFFVVAGLLGSALPLLCQAAVPAGAAAGRGVSFVYGSNIAGSVIGSLGVGFVLMQYLGLRSISLLLGALAVMTGALVLLFCEKRLKLPTSWTVTATAGALVTIGLASPLYQSLFEKLIFSNTPARQVPFAQTIENRNGVINVTAPGAVFGGGVYDGYVRIDPNQDVNLVVRALALSAYNPAPTRMLMIGLSSGSWGQIFVNHPQVQSLDIVEINPGYLELIRRSPVVSSLLSNPKARIYVDDGRRWLIAHPEARYDAIVANTTFHWRDHAATLLSNEFFKLIRKHLNPGGTYYFNTTESVETIATALSVFPYGLRVFNFLVVSDSPIVVSQERWFEHLHHYQINGRLLFDPGDPHSKLTLAGYASLAESVNAAPIRTGLETSNSLRARIGNQRIITDDNMGLEWEPKVDIPWH
jgi:predicted membrane-bound spermidine synthase